MAIIAPMLVKVMTNLKLAATVADSDSQLTMVEVLFIVKAKPRTSIILAKNHKHYLAVVNQQTLEKDLVRSKLMLKDTHTVIAAYLMHIDFVPEFVVVSLSF